MRFDTKVEMFSHFGAYLCSLLGELPRAKPYSIQLCQNIQDIQLEAFCEIVGQVSMSAKSRLLLLDCRFYLSCPLKIPVQNGVPNFASRSYIYGIPMACHDPIQIKIRTSLLAPFE